MHIIYAAFVLVSPLLSKLWGLNSFWYMLRSDYLLVKIYLYA